MNKWDLIWVVPLGLWGLYIIIRIIGAAWYYSYFNTLSRQFPMSKKAMEGIKKNQEILTKHLKEEKEEK